MTDTTITIDEGLRTIIPALADFELERLAESIADEGCKQPLELWGRILLDGHHRYAICRQLGIPFATRQVEGIETRGDAIAWMIRNQIGRRSLNEWQRACLVVSWEKDLAADAKLSQGARTDLDISTDLPRSDTRKRLAAMARMSEGNMAKAQRVHRAGNRIIIEALGTSRISLNFADRLLSEPHSVRLSVLHSDNPRARLKEYVAVGEQWGVVPDKPCPELLVLDELREVLPPRLPVQREAVEANVLKYGPMRPIAVMGRVLVDGFDTYEVCRRHGIAFETSPIRPEESTMEGAALYRTKMAKFDALPLDRIQHTIGKLEATHPEIAERQHVARVETEQANDPTYLAWLANAEALAETASA